jgi:hypothetical protein
VRFSSPCAVVFLFFPATAAAQVSFPVDLPSCSPWVDFHSTREGSAPPCASRFQFCLRGARILAPPRPGVVFVAAVLGLASRSFPASAPPRVVSLPHALGFGTAAGLGFPPHQIQSASILLATPSLRSLSFVLLVFPGQALLVPARVRKRAR